MNTKHKEKNEQVQYSALAGVSRREFLKTTMKAGVFIASSDYLLNSSENLVQLVAMKQGKEEFLFAYISDSHLLARGKEHRFARALIKAVEDVNAMAPQPDLVF